MILLLTLLDARIQSILSAILLGRVTFIGQILNGGLISKLLRVQAIAAH